MYERVKIDQEKLWEGHYSLDLFERPPTLLDKIWWPVYRFFRWRFNPANAYRYVKYFIQRAQRGYSDSDVWDLSTYLSTVIANSLRQLAETSHGWPGAQSPWPTFESWTEDLLRVADGLDHYVAGLKVEETCTCCGTYCNDTECPIVIRAFSELFEIWPGLWD